MPEVTLDKTYDPRSIEPAIYDRWERSNSFAARGNGDPYCIVIPPPNVTGSLHMGHAFQDTIMDALIRYHRMRGQRTLWQPGTDHAGIATQMVVERQLEQEGLTRHDLGREEFVARVWKWKEESGGTISRQLRRMGTSVDWTRERFTMDPDLSAAVLEVFVRLHEDGLIYRGKRLVNWDPVLHTAISDLEVVAEEEDGHLWHIRYPLSDGSGHVTVATTRPETMLGDTAVAVHPEDERFAPLIGRSVRLPLGDRDIPVIGDAYVDPAFGTGCLKITPAHDTNDYEVGRRHGLPMINIFTADARIVDVNARAPRASGSAESAVIEAADAAALIPERYHGLDRYDARKAIVADLEAAGLIEEVKPHKLMVPRGDRSRAVIEPYLTDQWFVRAAPLAAPAIEAVENGDIRFVPENWSRTYFEWMRNIQDWCISRQLWWGHRIPAWYDAEGNVYVARSEADAMVQARERHGHDVELERDNDVLDTWFSSALWPFSTLGWPDDTEELRTFYPTSVLVTGFDIIFFWVARMIMFGLRFTGKRPFAEVYIHGLVRDADGQKMSKSKGNILDPLDLIDGIDLESLVAKRTAGMMQPQLAKRIEQSTRKHFPDGIPSYGTDALRFTFASMATQGRDIRFDLGRIEGYRNFCNKLWNAARFVLMNTEGHDCGVDGTAVELGAAERWVISRLQKVEAEVDASIAAYRFDQVANTLYAFVWDEFCSWYVEMAKTTLNDPDTSDAARRGTRRTLVRGLETALRLLHPIMPFITEEIWHRVAPLAGCGGETIMYAPWPQSDAARIDEAAEAEVTWLQDMVTGLRTIRGEMNIEPARALPVMIQDAGSEDCERIERNRGFLRALARTESITVLSGDEPAPESATALVGGMKVLVPLGSLIDREAELQRLDREMERLSKDLERATGKLDNPHFVARAPEAVVEKERQRAADMDASLEKLRIQRRRVETLPG